jgi:Alpha-L-fucosidase
MNALSKLKADYIPQEVQGLSASETQWFRDAKFGMFVHFGLYSLLGRGEWVMFNERMSVDEYAELANSFTIPDFDATALAATARAAGMNYMVLTARHHDGFALFDSSVSRFTSVNSAAGRDLVAEYVEACRAEGLKVGLYYSPMDWRFPGYFFPELYLDSALAMRDQCQAQLRELMTNYGKIDLLWFDGEWLAHGGIEYDGKKGWVRDSEFGSSELYFKVNYFWESEKTIAMIRSLQPGIMINNRFGWQGDFHVRERRIGGMRTDKPWDSNDCLTISWGWIPGAPMLSLRECVRNLVEIAVRDGNYLLNVGPTDSGAIELRQLRRLSQLGAWLVEYGESLYGTRGGPFLPGEWGGTTYTGATIFIHIIEWQEDEIVLPPLAQGIVEAGSLTSKRFEVQQDERALRIRVPQPDRHQLDTILTLRLDSPIEWKGCCSKEEDIYGLADGLGK